MTENTDIETASSPGARAGRCAIVGRPNVGKSTLLNAILGQRLVIATPRPGTTRTSVIGVYASEDPPTQIAFVDTPGLHRPKSALGKVLVEQAQLGLADAEVVVFLTEPPRRKDKPEVRPEDEAVLQLLEGSTCPVLLAINKVDLLPNKEVLFPLIEAYTKRRDFDAVVPLSALKKKNLEPLISEIRSRLPEGMMYEADFFTDRPERFFVAEFLREAAIRHTRQEVPHGVAVYIEEFLEESNLTRVHATLVVEKDSHKGIVIGKRGAMLKTIGSEARQEIQRFLDRKVHLEVFVKVIPGWTGDPNKARKLAAEGSP